jgi:hypothetical protein
MTPVDTELTTRFAKSYTTAAFGYARAASAAYAALADQTLDFWAQAAKTTTSRQNDDFQPSKPYLVTGPRPYRSAFAPAPAPVSTPLDLFKVSNAWASSPMFAPMRAWWGLFPLEGNPTSWPMAYAMMTAGVPRAVALPAAEANIAAMDAAEAASASIDRAFSTYRSESGFAVAQIISPKALYGALMLAPFTASFKLPWLSA